MTDASIIINLPQMVDLALGSPEVGAVNFNVLHALLRVLIQRVKLNDCTVEFRGAESERIHSLISRANPNQGLRITEYQISDEKSKRKSSAVEKEIGVISPRRDSKQEPKEAQPFVIPQKDSTVVLVERTSLSRVPALTVAVSENRFYNLEKNFEMLNRKIQEIIELPNNSTLMQAVRSQSSDKGTPVVDMWQILHLNKRVDGVEGGVNKLASMVEDIIRDISPNEHGERPEQPPVHDTKEPEVNEEEHKRTSIRATIFSDITNRLKAVEDKLNELSKEQAKDSGKPEASNEKPALDEDDVLEMNAELDTLRKTIKSVETDFNTLTKGFKGKKLMDLVKDIDEMKDALKKLTKDPESEEQAVSSNQIIELQENLQELTQKINNLDDLLNNQMNVLQGHLFEIEKEVGSLMERVNTIAAIEEENANTSVTEIYNRVLKLQDELEIIDKKMNAIIEEKEEKQMAMDALVEQLQYLKTVKADREDLQDALADKADRQHMNRKVSHDQFDAACGDINRSIEETMRRIQEQENIWHSTLEEIQITVGSKIDKVEFDPLKDFVDKKIHLLQERLKALMAMKEEQEAAGVRSKVLRDVNCLSCDKGVVINKQNKIPAIPMPPVVSGNLSMKPYITYELDAVRKQQRLIPKGRNLNLLESALKEVKAKEKGADKGLPPTTHLCNRYCGGSHTITTPQQRVAHIGHFMNQWGPQVISLDPKPKEESGQESPRVGAESEQKKNSRASVSRQSRLGAKPSKLSRIIEMSEEEKEAADTARTGEKLDDPKDIDGRSKSVRLSQTSRPSREERGDEKEKRSSRKSTKSLLDQSKTIISRSSKQEARSSVRSSTKRSQSRRVSISKPELSDSNIAQAELESILGHAELIMAERSMERMKAEEETEVVAEAVSEPVEEVAPQPISEPVTEDEEMPSEIQSEPEDLVE